MGDFEKKLQQSLSKGKEEPIEPKEKKSFWRSFNDSKNRLEKEKQDKANDSRKR